MAFIPRFSQKDIQTDLSVAATLLEGLKIRQHIGKATLSTSSSSSNEWTASEMASPKYLFDKEQTGIVPEVLVLQQDRSQSLPDRLSPDRSAFSPCKLCLSPPSPKSPKYNIDLKSGSVGLLEFDINGQQFSTRVFVKVFGNNYEQHAQIYTDSSYTILLGYISLRNCEIKVNKTDPNVVEIILNNEVDEKGNAKKVVLLADNDKDALDWVMALTPQLALPLETDSSPRGSPKMPRHFLFTVCK